MSQPTAPPALTPQFCFNERALRDFLRLSRATIDDSISTHLNALLTPSTTNPFTPTSTTTPSPLPSTRPIPPTSCTTFKTHVLFPTWSTRTTILEYCTSVATSPDPDDPTLPLRQFESEADRHRIVNERLDPYSGRFFPREARTERLASTLRMEWGVEKIVRRRTWGVVGERCGEPDLADEVAGRGREGWEDALDKWKEERVEKNARTAPWK